MAKVVLGSKSYIDSIISAGQTSVSSRLPIHFNSKRRGGFRHKSAVCQKVKKKKKSLFQFHYGLVNSGNGHVGRGMGRMGGRKHLLSSLSLQIIRATDRVAPSLIIHRSTPCAALPQRRKHFSGEISQTLL